VLVFNVITKDCTLLNPKGILPMKTTFISLFLAAALILGLGSCSNYVQSIQPRQDVIADALLTTPDQLPFLLNGLQQRITNCYSQTTTLAGGLSDELYYSDRVPGATFPTFQEIDLGVILLDNNSVNNLWGSLGSLRFTADNLVERIGNMKFADGQAAQRTAALYQAYLYAGLIRHMYAAYYGLEPRRGGGVLSRGETPRPFIPSAAMTDSALAMLNLSLQNASTDLQRRTVNSLIAKVNLSERRYDAARAAAQNGLKRGDAALVAQYSAATVTNQWFNDAGRGRTQLVPDSRFAAYIAADSAEGRLLPGRNSGNSFFANGFDNTPDDPALGALAASRRLVLIGPLTTAGFTYYIQQRYPNQGNSVPITSWQENELILAETAIRIANNSDAALVNVNTVRSFYSLTARTVTTLDSVMIERDKTLFGTGTRLTDQRRFAIENRSLIRPAQTYVDAASRNSAWHLGASTWWYLPIGLPERSANPNLGN
jgi:hypothetical protein